jgi:hypothetical protein
MAAGAEGDSNLPVSHVGREQVLDALKAAFVHGRLAKDEFDLRVGQVLAAYAELDAVTADIPTALTTAQPPETIRKSHNKKLIQRGTAAGTGASMALTATIAVAAKGNPVISVVVVGLAGVFVAVLLAGLLRLVSWVLEMVSSRQPLPSPPPGPSVRQPSAWHRPARPDHPHRSAAIHRTRPKLRGAFPAAFVQFEATASTDPAAHRVAPGPGQDGVLAPCAQYGHACPPVPRIAFEGQWPGSSKVLSEFCSPPRGSRQCGHRRSRSRRKSELSPRPSPCRPSLW